MSKVMTAEIIINNPSRAVDKRFSYLYDEKPSAGDSVVVPFGKGDTLVQGVVIGFCETEDTLPLKKINHIGERLFDEKQLELILWLREKYLCTYYDALKILLPPGALTRKNRDFSGSGNRTVQFATAIEKEDAEKQEILETLKIKAPTQYRVMEILYSADEIAVSDLTELADSSRAAVKALEKKGLVKIFDNVVERSPFKNIEIGKTLPLNPTDEQEKAISYINEAVKAGRFEEILLRGITGSGKTEVYLQAVDNALKIGKRAIILVPEISLTPQMSERFASRFKDNVAILHSGLSLGERFDEWEKIRTGRANVVVGARSAIFAPVKNVGIIVVDEEHENSYKSDMTPKYDAREVASKICSLNNSVLVLASATPSMKNALRAVNGEIKLLQIKNRYNKVLLPEAEVVDLRYEMMRGNKSFISTALKEEIEKNIKNKEQTIIFLNRRGYSTFVSCRSCGYVAKCPVCDVALTYHKYNETLMCHYCGYTTNNFTTCPDCKSKYIKHFGIGTQKVVEELKSIFPDASVLRMDIDTTRGKMSHYKILEQFKNEKTDILVGTQMITKGLDFPDVTLVGVLAADMMLYVDDYAAGERTFQLITQVLGRAGRGEKRGRAIIQTYSPNHPVIEFAKEQDYKSFYSYEIAHRKKTNYPPFCDIIHLLISGEDVEKVKNTSAEIFRKIKARFEEEGIASVIIGPSPSPLAKINSSYRYRIIIKCKNSAKIRTAVRELVLDKPVRDISTSIDINPSSII